MPNPDQGRPIDRSASAEVTAAISAARSVRAQAPTRTAVGLGRATTALVYRRQARAATVRCLAARRCRGSCRLPGRGHELIENPNDSRRPRTVRDLPIVSSSIDDAQKEEGPMNHLHRSLRARRMIGWVLASCGVFATGNALAVAVRIDSFAPPRKSSTGAVRKGTDLMKVTLDLALHPDAICNDGSPGVIYVRRASAPADANKWALYLQGGGSCHSFEDCLARWTHKGSNYGAHKMSTDTRLAPAGGVNYLAPPGIRG